MVNNNSDVSDGYSESDVILITIYQLTKKKKYIYIYINLRYRKTSNMVIIALKKEEKKEAQWIFKRVVYHATYALLLIPYNDVVEDKALLHNAMNFLSTAIGWLKGNKSFSNDRCMD